jgi:tyrosyl-tRNA synthetase
VLMALKRLACDGHIPIVLIGGATAMIGDPSGRQAERAPLSHDEIKRNSDGIVAAINRVVQVELIVNNADWTNPMSLFDFLGGVGKQMKVSQMLLKDSVRSRCSQHLH